MALEDKPNESRERPARELQNIYALELSSYAEIFKDAEPYLMDLFAATCWDASETPTVEGARQFWEHVRAQNPSPLPPPARPGAARSRPNTPREKPWTAEDRLSFRCLRFGAAAASCLAMQLKGKQFTKLDLSENQLGDNAAAAIASLLHVLPLRSLVLAGNILGPAGIKEIANSELGSNETLEHLALGQPSPAHVRTRQRPNHITTEGLQSLLSSLAKNPLRCLSSLELCRTALRADAGKVLADYLDADSVLTSLDVSGNAFTSEGISTLLPACLKLKKLDIADTSCKGEQIHTKLCDLLQKTKSLTSLSVAYNFLEPRPLRRIARALSTCPPLLTLNLTGTGMETEGVIALAESFLSSQVSNLRELDISENGISELEAASHVAKIIAGTKLQTLRLNRNPLGDSGACELAEALTDCPSLRSLELGSCRVGHLGASILFRSLRENENLLCLRLSDNFLDDSLDITMIEALPFLQQLQLESNRLSHRQLSRIAEVCARNRYHVRDKEPRALRHEIQSLQPAEVLLKQHKQQAAKDRAELSVRVSAVSIAADELRQLRLGIMMSAKQTEQKVAAAELTLLQRRQYLESIKEALADTARKSELAIAQKTEALTESERELLDVQGRLRDVEAKLARRRAQHPKQVAEIREEISAALPKTEELKTSEEEMRRELKALQEKSLIGFKP